MTGEHPPGRFATCFVIVCTLNKQRVDMAKKMSFKGYDWSSAASQTKLASYADSDDFAIFSYNDEYDGPSKMSPVFVKFVHIKAVVSHEFISGFECTMGEYGKKISLTNRR